MNKFKFLFILCFLFFTKNILYAQCGNNNVNHWEAIVLDKNTWKYTVPAAAIPNWTALNFNDAAWSSGIGGIGFGDNDDSTVIATSSRSVYMRKTFTVIDTSVLSSVIFCMDYDDGYIAYLNGVEIARSNMTGAPPAFNALATASHEAQLYQNNQPDYITLNSIQIDTLIKQGLNVLCVQTHNNTVNSNDLTSRPFLIAGISNGVYNYQQVPNWFAPPFALYTNLPIVVINTGGQNIVDDPRIIANMGIIDNGPGNMNCVYDPYNNYNGKISIEIRGASSQSVPKKQYGFSTLDANNLVQNVSLLGLPKENDFTFNATYTDKSFLREAITFDLARYMGWYTTRYRYVEMVINGEYRGIYILQEKVKTDKNRVDIAKMNNTMNAGDSLTGGYIVKVDWMYGNAGGSWSTSQGVTMQNHVPQWDEITVTQKNYIKAFINSFEADLFGANFTDPAVGYRRSSNPYSFADHFILQELSNNIDGYRASNYLHKDRDSRCSRYTFAPFWDFNFTYGNPDWCYGQYSTGWQLTNGCGTQTSKYLNKMLQDQWFKNIINCRWFSLRQTELNYTYLANKIDSMAQVLRPAAIRDSAKWSLNVWPVGYVYPNLNKAVDSLKSWINLRMNWIDANMYPATQQCNATAGLNVIIDEINFNSDSTFNSGDWFELYNAGATTADLSYAIIMNGDSYNKYCVIPNGTTLAPGARLIVYEDSLAFATAYPSVTNKIGPLCHKLGNGGDKIVIKDKDNKDIFSMTYSDQWQCVTDGHARTLQLTTPTANPNMESSWFAGCIGGSPGVAYSPCTENLIYSEINYNAGAVDDAGDWVELHNKNTTALSIGGWKIGDDNNNSYTFPAGTTVPAQGYLVVYSDATKFNALHPTVSNKVGPTGFGLKNISDVIKIYDNTGKVKFTVCYKSTSPWPTTASGTSKTLENSAYTANQNAYTTWFAGCPKGSPGVAYTPCINVSVNDQTKDDYITLYPNPTSSELQILSSMSIDEISLLDYTGRFIQKVQLNNNILNVSHLQAGIYMLQCKSNNLLYNVKFVKTN